MSSINADNGVVSGITGIRTTADSTGNLALQSNGVTVLTVNTANTVAVGSGGITFSDSTTITSHAPPNVTVYTSGSGNYSTPTGAKFLIVEMVAGGGGSGGGAGTGGTGCSSSFNSITAIGGTGASAPAGGAGGTGGTGTASLRIAGGAGGMGKGSGAVIALGGAGGSTPLGFGPPTNINTGVGTVVPAVAGQVYGSGASGPPGDLSTYGSYAGGGGGEYARLLITSPSASYSYAVGAGGAGAGTSPTGAAGAAGVVIVTAYF